jgi:hypothetical protein
MSLFWRSWLIVSVLIVVVLGALSILAALQFNRIESNLIRGRLAVLATTVQAPFQSAVRLGLPLASVRSAAAILERPRITDPQIAAIHVFEPTGRIIHSSETDPPTSVRAEVLFAISDANQSAWSVDAGDFIFTGMKINNAAGATVGGVVVAYPKIDLLKSVQAMIARLLLYSALTLGLMSVVALALLRFGLAEPIAFFAAVDETLDGFERDFWRRPAAGAYVSSPHESGLGFDTQEIARLLHEAEESYLRGGQELAALEASNGEQGADR